MSWVDRFFAFFREIEPTLAVVLNASSCREGWLQGEFYRHFRTDDNGFEVNRRFGDGKLPFDLCCLTTPVMIAELKVYGESGYYSKNLFGRSNIRRFLPARAGERVPITATDIGTLLGGAKGNSYLHDVCRLQTVSTDIERYLILVLQKAEEADNFGRAIAAVQVGTTEFDLELDAFRVRVSRF